MNVRGERFDLRRLGFTELLRLPRQGAEGAQPLLSVLGRVEADSTCADTFIKELDFGGGWLSRSGKLTFGTSGAGHGAREAISLTVNGTALDVAGLRAAEGLEDVLEVVTPEIRKAKESTNRAQKIRRQTFLTVNMRFPQAKLSVDWVHRRTARSDVNHLNLKVASLPKPTQGWDAQRAHNEAALRSRDSGRVGQRSPSPPRTAPPPGSSSCCLPGSSRTS